MESGSFNWVNVNTAGSAPSPRIGHRTVYDPVRHKIILIGGHAPNAPHAGNYVSATHMNDVWELDTASNTWTDVTPAGGDMPVGRSDFGMAYDITRNKVVIYGGEIDGWQAGDTWEWDPATHIWTAKPAANSLVYGGMLGSSMAYDPNRHQVILFGGHAYYNWGEAGTWAWDGNDWINLTGITYPPPRFLTAMATDSSRSKVVMFGGQNPSALNDTWEWDGSAWTEITSAGASPSARSNAGMAYDVSRHETILFGGGQEGTFNDTWSWDGSAWAQEQPSTNPSPRASFLAYDSIQSRLVFFGGGNLADTWYSQSTFTGPASLPTVTGECSATITSPPTAIDNCAGLITGTTNDPLTYSSQGTFVVHWSYDDGLGNVSTQEQKVIVKDVTKPVPNIASLPDITGECSATIPSAPTATDNCAGPLTGTTSDPLTYSSQGMHVVHWTYDDGHGNISTQNQNVIVKDVTAPAPDLASLPTVTGECAASIAAPPTAHDNCAGSIVGTTTDPLTYSTQGTFTVTWHYSDGHGNESSQTQTVVVKDTTAAVPNFAALPDITGECSATIPVAPKATDNCAGIITGTTSDPLTYSSQGTYVVHWTYDDGHGNISTQDQNVIVRDVTAPLPDVATLPTVNGECSASIAAPPKAHDNCAGTIVGTTSDPLNYSTQGTFTVTWHYSDGNGNESTQTQTVVVKDITAPVPNIPSLPTVTSECAATIPSAPAATDNCAGSIIGTTTDALSYSEQGTFTVTWHYNDGNGNESTQTQTVVVKDATAPTLDVPADVTVNTGDGATSCGALVPDSIIGSANGGDNCGLQSVVRTGVPAGNIFPVGTTTLTYTATDIHGLVNTRTQRVTVIDKTAPVLNVPANLSINTAVDATSCTAFVDNAFLTATATDNCGVDAGSFTRSGVPAGNNFPVGTTAVTYTVKDIHGNLSSGTQTVTVADATLPVITLTGKPITLWPPDHKYQTIKVADLIASATDNCDPSVSLSKVVISMVTSDEPENINSGDGNTLNDIVIAADCKSVDLRAERDGAKNGRVYTIYFQVKDAAGNVQTVKATVSVPKSQGPMGGAVDDTPTYPLPPPYKVMGSCSP
jgi:hypothetical protein